MAGKRPIGAECCNGAGVPGDVLPMSDTSPRGGRRVPLVLHVVEAYGAGVASAVRDYIRSIPEVRHVVLAYSRPGVAIADELTPLLIELPEGRRAQVRAVRLMVRALRPDIIHAHSSFAGAYVRLGIRRRGARIVYSPHCYAFERRDLSVLARTGFWALEAVMAWRTDGVGTVGEWERIQADRLPSAATTVVVPHRRQPGLVSVDGPGSGPIVTVGRIQPQKDPAFFAAAARDARVLGGWREWRWIGGGDPELEQLLRDSGVTVTGWKSRAGVLAELSHAHAYVHTAAWEGNPIAVVEASAAGLPIVARDIPALRHTGVGRLAANPIELAQRVLELDDEERWQREAEQARQFAAGADLSAQADALRDLYGLPVPARDREAERAARLRRRGAN
jgi:glycosyltransferase involved in cell wall biosynthesis